MILPGFFLSIKVVKGDHFAPSLKTPVLMLLLRDVLFCFLFGCSFRVLCPYADEMVNKVELKTKVLFFFWDVRRNSFLIYDGFCFVGLSVVFLLSLACKGTLAFICFQGLLVVGWMLWGSGYWLRFWKGVSGWYVGCEIVYL